MPNHPRITLSPAIMGGKPCIRGMRVTAGMVWGQLQSGETHTDILTAYPYLEEEDIVAVEEYFRSNDEPLKDS